MHSSLTAVVLCIFAQAASAQCAAPAAPAAAADTRHITPVNAQSVTTPAIVKAPATTVASVQPRGELIKAAAAGTREDAPPSMRESPRLNEQEHPRRGGTAMLLAALALMSGIALRRYGAPDR